ncbi:MAG: serpin family protein [Gemmataceae bacterium]
MKRILPLALGVLVLIGLIGRAADDAKAPLEDVKSTVTGDNRFAFELYGKIRDQEGNLFLSPYSISTALAMTSAGARGTTDAEMVKTMHLIPEQAKRHAAFGELIRLTRRDGKTKGVQLSVANALWGQKGYPFEQAFLTTTDKNYGAGLREVDFVQTETARQAINKWVEENTNDKIKDLIAKGVLQSDTRLVLTNAIYFKGDWATQFKKDATREAPFFLSADKQVKAPLMNQTGHFKLYQDADVQMLELPYEGKSLSMLVVLPRKKDGLAEVEKGLTADKLDTWLGKMGRPEVVVSLPKFKTTAKFELAPVLSKMGMPSPFSDRADFSGMNGGKESLFISNVIHQGFVDVNEEGTEAAAATAVVIRPTSAAIDRPVVFRADHPFLFLIRDHTTGSILFLGRLSDPTK